jgi:hypothetical protein
MRGDLKELLDVIEEAEMLVFDGQVLSRASMPRVLSLSIRTSSLKHWRSD